MNACAPCVTVRLVEQRTKENERRTADQEERLRHVEKMMFRWAGAGAVLGSAMGTGLLAALRALAGVIGG